MHTVKSSRWRSAFSTHPYPEFVRSATVVLQMSMKKENSICKSEELGAHNTQVLYPLSNRTKAPLIHNFLSSTDTGFPWLELVFVKTERAKNKHSMKNKILPI